jgi:hypothetical protein
MRVERVSFEWPSSSLIQANRSRERPASCDLLFKQMLSALYYYKKMELTNGSHPEPVSISQMGSAMRTPEADVFLIVGSLGFFTPDVALNDVLLMSS